MRILHIIPKHPIFTNGAISFQKNALPEYNFDFLVIDKSNESISGTLEYPKIENVRCEEIKNNRQEKEIVFKCFEDYDLVFFHSMLLSPQTKFSILKHKREYIRKIVWIEWGYDLYLSNPDSIIDAFKYCIKKLLMVAFERKIPFFLAIHPCDVEEYKKIVKGNAIVSYVPYTRKFKIQPINEEEYTTEKMEEKKSIGKPIYIQIGQRAWKYLNHKKWLDKLARFKDENIVVFLPLSYGDKEYGDYIEKYARQIFGEKALTLREILPIDEYRQLLSNVDIFILDSDRQIALGNIYPLFKHQKKLYLPKNSSISNYYQKLGITICDIVDIESITFDELTTDVDMAEAARHMRIFDCQDNTALWRTAIEKIVESRSSN